MLVCQACGQENLDGFRFCGACGTALAKAPSRREERKVVTALFCDLVGSTAQAERMDVEDVQAILTRYHETVAADIERFGGTVEKFIGDAVVALFGVPVAHEDDPERAVRAALTVRQWVSGQDDVHVRMGINTGEALVQVGARPEQGELLATGDVLNTAARLQSAAPVDGILVGEHTQRVTRRVIEYREHPPVEAKGKAQPVPVWEVLDARSRFGSDVDERPTHPLVGRERELGILQDVLARCKSERVTQLVTLVGVPGIGKSRLVAELFRIADASREVYFWRQGRSLPYGESQSFWALAEIVKAQAGILENDGAEEASAKLSEMVSAAVDDAEDRGWVEGHLLALVGLTPASESGADNREEAFAAWRRLLEGLAEQLPLILVFEDLHWADDGLLDFIDHLADWATTSAMLLIGTARPELLERRPAWGGGKRNSTTLSIPPLSDEETQSLLSSLLDQVLMPTELRAPVVSLAAGNPLYAAEYVRMLQDGGLLKRVGRTWRLDERRELPLPETVQGVVAARIDALPAAEKALLQDCAVVGKVFWPSAVAAIGDREGPDTQSLLHALERKEFVRRDRRSVVARETQYVFLHAIVRDVAYRQIPRTERAEKHRSVAEWIERLAPDRSADRVEMLAHHYRTALELTRAAGRDAAPLLPATRAALVHASERAEALNVWTAARDVAREALELVDRDDPVGPVLAVRVAQASVNLSENDPDTAVAARERSVEQGDRAHAAEADALLSRMLWSRGEGAAAREAAERAVELVEGLPPSPAKLWVVAQRARLSALAVEEDSEAALVLVEEGIAMAAEIERDDYLSHLLNTRGLFRSHVGDPGSVDDLRRAIELAEKARAPVMKETAHNNLAQILWSLGRVEEGGAELEAFRETSRRYGTQSSGWLDAEAVYLAYLRGEYREMIERGERYLAAREGESFYMEAPQCSNLGHGYASTGRIDVGLAYTARGLELARATLGHENQGFGLLAHGHALWVANRAEESTRVLDELLGARRLLLDSYWLAPLPLVLHEQGRRGAVLPMLDAAPPSPWRDAARAVMDDRLLDAAEIYRQIGTRFVWAWTLLLAGECGQLGTTELGEAAAHFTRIGATPYIRRIEALALASRREASR